MAIDGIAGDARSAAGDVPGEPRRSCRRSSKGSRPARSWLARSFAEEIEERLKAVMTSCCATGATRSSTSTTSTRSSGRGPRAAASATCSNRCSPGARCASSRRRRPKASARSKSAIRGSSAASPPCSAQVKRRRPRIRRSRSCGASPCATRRTTRCRSAIPPWSARSAWRSGTCRIAPFPTARSICWTRPLPVSASRSTAFRPRRSISRSAAWLRSGRRSWRASSTTPTR